MKQALQILMIFLSILIPTSVWGQGTIGTNKVKRGKVNPSIKSIKGEEEFKAAHEYYANHEYETALYWLQKAADLGHGVAQNDLALMFQYGIGTQADSNKAVYWYNKAIASGYTVASFQLNLLNYVKDLASEAYWPTYFSFWQEDAWGEKPEFSPTLYFENNKTALTRENKLLLNNIIATLKEQSDNRNIIISYDSIDDITEVANSRVKYVSEYLSKTGNLTERLLIRFDSYILTDLGFMGSQPLSGTVTIRFED